jgi:hypothetical protein
MMNFNFGAGASGAGAASHNGSGSTKMMQLLATAAPQQLKETSLIFFKIN